MLRRSNHIVVEPMENGVGPFRQQGLRQWQRRKISLLF